MLGLSEVQANPSVKRDCGTGVAGFLNRLCAAAPYLQRWASGEAL
jgi:hypothetical protein